MSEVTPAARTVWATIGGAIGAMAILAITAGLIYLGWNLAAGELGTVSLRSAIGFAILARVAAATIQTKPEAE